MNYTKLIKILFHGLPFGIFHLWLVTLIEGFPSKFLMLWLFIGIVFLYGYILWDERR